MGSIESALNNYMESGKEEGGDKLREQLKKESADKRYELLINVEGVAAGRFRMKIGSHTVNVLSKGENWTGLHSATLADDLETIKYMLDDFSSNQKYDVVKIQKSDKLTALHIAADRGHTSIIYYLLSNLSQQQKYDLLKFQNNEGDTRLHSS